MSGGAFARSLRTARAFSFVLCAGGVGCAAQPEVAPRPPTAGVVARRLPPGERGAPEICFNARDDDDNGLIDEGCGVEQSELTFLLAWSEPESDFELYVGGPSGEVARSGSQTRDGLTKLRDCPSDGPTCSGGALESVIWDGSERFPGRYRLRVRLEDPGGREPPRRVWLGVRVDDRAISYELSFGEGATEWLGEVEVPPPPTGGPPRARSPAASE